MTDAPAPSEPTDDEQRAEVAEQKLVRLAKRERLIASGAEAYPVAAPVTTTIPAVRATEDAQVLYGITEFAGLGILDRPFVPHLHSPDHPESGVMALVAANSDRSGQPYWARRDGQVLVIYGGSVAPRGKPGKISLSNDRS